MPSHLRVPSPSASRRILWCSQSGFRLSEIEKERKDSIHSIAFLQATAPYELGMLGPIATNSCLYPMYVRAETYLSAREGANAAVEFQEILDRRGLLSGIVRQACCPVSDLRELLRCRATTQKPGLHIKISSPHGRLPTPTFPSSSLQNPSTLI